jgi:hypothetical protein
MMARVWNFAWPYLRELIVFATAIVCSFILASVLAAASMLIHDGLTAKESLGGHFQFLMGMATMWWARRP